MFTLGSTVSLKRPLGYDDAAEDKSFRMLVYDDSRVIDGQTLEYGLRASSSLVILISWVGIILEN